MPKALGLIETRGLVAGIEAADAMVKAANVSIIGKEITRPALVTIKITGDVAAVKSAVDAGEAAARKVGEVVSVHVIPQPDDQIISILPELNSGEVINEFRKTPEPEKATEPEQVIKSEQVIEPVPEKPKVKEEKIVKKVTVEKPVKTKVNKEYPIKTREEKPNNDFAGTLFENSNDTISRLRKEALQDNSAESDLLEEVISKETDLAEEIETRTAEIIPGEYDSMNVHQLRHLARSKENFPIKGREISKANRQDLIKLLESL